MRRRPFSVLVLLTAALAVIILTASADAGEKEPVRTDRYGDPLPQGSRAVARHRALLPAISGGKASRSPPTGKILASGGL